MIHLGSVSLPGPPSRPFRFLASWISHPEFSPLVERIWNEEPDLLTCINKFTAVAQCWNIETFGSIGRRKRRLLNRIQGIQTKLDDPNTSSLEFLVDLDVALKEELEEVCL
ncbi:hypothetical protein K1719_010268 [Acacia pycnantha]|nr:hypothetical protein K1719_010268 [Acacia pycnantha]